jgi:hypothetical protein
VLAIGAIFGRYSPVYTLPILGQCSALSSCRLTPLEKITMGQKEYGMGTYKVRNEIETKRNETKRNETKRNEINENETKRNETKRNQQKRNETKRNQRNENEMKRNQRKQNEIN